MEKHSRKIRIMHLNSCFGYDGPSRGIIGQTKYMNMAKFQPVFCEIKPTRHSGLINTITGMGCEHISLCKNKAYDVSIILKIVLLLKSRRIDVLNTHNALACWYGNIAAKIAQIPVVFTLRNNQRQNYRLLLRKKPFYETARALDCVTMRAADKVVAVSKRLERFYIKNERIPPKKIITINNAIDFEPIRQYDKKRIRISVRKKIGCMDDTIVVGIVGDLVERKGHACLIEAARRVLKENENAIFLIIGDGPLKAELIEKTNEHSIFNKFVFTGQIKNVFPYVAAMDIFILPSFAEGISRALMESMAMGLPSVCSAIDGNIEAVHDGETGFLFPVNDHDSLARKLLFLMENKEVRKGMGKKARAWAEEKFDMKNLARAYEKLYLELFNAYSIECK